MNKDMKFILYGFLIVVGFFLIVAFASRLGENDNYYTYNGFDFVRGGNMTRTQIQIDNNLYTIEIRYGPKQVEDIPIVGEPRAFLDVDSSYVTFDPKDENLKYVGLATADIQLNLAKVLGKKLVAGCTRPDEGCKNVSIVNCDNTNAPVILVEQDPVAYVEQRGNCLMVKGPDMELVKAADRLLLYLYGIMEK